MNVDYVRCGLVVLRHPRSTKRRLPPKDDLMTHASATPPRKILSGLTWQASGPVPTPDAPADEEFQEWLDSISDHEGASGSAAAPEAPTHKASQRGRLKTLIPEIRRSVPRPADTAHFSGFAEPVWPKWPATRYLTRIAFLDFQRRTS